MVAIKGMEMPKECYRCPLLDREYGTCNIIGETKVDMTKERASNCPLVEIQEPRTGHWIITNDYYTGAYSNIDYVKCSCCNEYSLEEGDYCPNCGAKMAESEEV